MERHIDLADIPMVAATLAAAVIARRPEDGEPFSTSDAVIVFTALATELTACTFTQLPRRG